MLRKEGRGTCHVFGTLNLFCWKVASVRTGEPEVD